MVSRHASRPHRAGSPENSLKRQIEAGHDIPGRHGGWRHEPGNPPIGGVGHEHSGRRVDVPHKPGSGSEPIGRLGGHRRGPVIRREYFYDQIRRAREVAGGQTAGEAIATDEGHVGSSHRVGIAAEDEAGLGGKDLPKASVAVPTAPAARSDSPG